MNNPSGHVYRVPAPPTPAPSTTNTASTGTTSVTTSQQPEPCTLCKTLGTWLASTLVSPSSPLSPPIALSPSSLASSSSAPHPSSPSEQATFSHHPSWPSLAESAESGCPLCRRLARVAEERFCGGSVRTRLAQGRSTAVCFRIADADSNPDSNPDSVWTGRLEAEGEGGMVEEEEGKMGGAGAVAGGTGRLRRLGRVNVDLGMPWACFEVEVEAEEVLADGRSAGKKLPSRPIIASTNDAFSSPTIQSGLKWLHHCQKTHTKCRNISLSFVPTRLVDVWPSLPPTVKVRRHSSSSSSDRIDKDMTSDVKLVETADLAIHLKEFRRGPSLEYIALSHCWGKTHHLTTTQATLGERKRSIPWSLLNKTFQDAVTVTRQLGIRYVWIDSLCIVQDSGPDWEYEAARMGLVYGNCVLNVCADAAEDGDQGFLPDVTPIALPYHLDVPKSSQAAPLNVPSQAPAAGWQRREGTIYLRQVEVKRFVSFSGDLRRRGWVFQEYVLSARSLRYGTYGLLWECREGWESADSVVSEENQWRADYRALKRFPSSLLPSSSPSAPPISSSSYSSDLDNNNHRPAIDIKEILPIWRRLVQDYTRKELTRETDHLPAIAGLADLIQRATRVSHNGIEMTERYLAGTWASDLPKALAWRAEDPDWRATEAETYLAPSWSWAAAKKQCPILFPTITLPFQVSVIEAVVEPEGTSPLGRVRDGHLKLEAWVTSVTVTPGRRDGDGSQLDPLDSVEVRTGPNQTLLRSSLRKFFRPLTGPLPRMLCLLLAGDVPGKPEGKVGLENDDVKKRCCVLLLEEVGSGAGAAAAPVYRRFDIIVAIGLTDTDWVAAEKKIVTLI